VPGDCAQPQPILLRVLRAVRQRLQGEEAELDPSEIDELRALGYIQ
jgi:hypothetical protein